MIFSHPFPAATDGQKWAREALSAAFASYNREYGITLDKKSCKFNFPQQSHPLIRPTVDEHRSNILGLVSTRPFYLLNTHHTPPQAMRAARNQRGKFRLTVMGMVRKSRELGIGSEVPITIIAERVEMLLHKNSFLDAPYMVSRPC